MAINPKLNFVWVKGVYRDPLAAEEVDLWDWAQVWHVNVGVKTGGQVDPDKLDLLATDKMNLLASGGLFGGMAAGMICTSRGAVNLLTEEGSEVVEDVDMQVGDFLPSCSPQSALLVVGTGEAMGHQTRKWIPGIRRDALEERVGRWKHPPDGFGDNLMQWAGGLIKPRNYFGLGPGFDVIWSPSTETARTITTIRCQVWPRTIRQRSNDAESEWVHIPL